MLGLATVEYGVEHEQTSFVLESVAQSQVLAMPELPEDELLRARANRFMRAVGSCAIDHSMETGEQEHVLNDSLLTAIKRGAEGDTEAQKMVAVNVGSDFSERVLKAGEVTKYYLQKDENDELVQFGQPYASVYANSLRLTPESSKLRLRTEAETRNAERIAYHAKNGLLDEYYAVVFSLCPEDMTDEELEEAGYFSDTKTMAVQVTTAEKDAVSIESAFVAGVKEKGAPRHDLDAVIKLVAEFEIDYSNMSTTEIIDTPLLIPKSLLPNGVIDLVELLDNVVGGTFFGQDRPRHDYQTFRLYCDERRKSYAADIEAVMQKLLAEAGEIHTQQEAIDRLNKLSGAQMVRRAVKDKTIDASVFGSEAAGYIEQARFYADRGEKLEVSKSEAKAIQTETSRSCPSGVSRQSEWDSNSTANAPDKTESKTGEDKYGSLTFKCPKGHTNRRPRNKLIPHCQVCGTSVRC